MPDTSLVSQLAALGIRPKKGLGQNFLVEPAHRARIIAAAELTQDDTVLEVGPGPGVLTELIAERAGRVIAVELDDRLIPFLHSRFAHQPQVSIVHADILKTDPAGLTGGEHYKVVANLPYYITSAVIRYLLECSVTPDLLVLTVQREVAERMVAAPPDMSLLALGVQFYCTGKIVARIPAGAFYPVPKVDSAVVRLDRRQTPVAGDVGGGGVLRGGARRVRPAAQTAEELSRCGIRHLASQGCGVA